MHMVLLTSLYLDCTRKKYPRSFGITRSNKGQILITSNGKTNGANMLALVKHAKVSTVTSPSDLQFRGQRSKRSNIKQHRMAKLAVPTCWPGQQMSNFKQRQSAKLGQTCQSVHSYLFVRPMIKGSKVIHGQILNKIK